MTLYVADGRWTPYVYDYSEPPYGADGFPENDNKLWRATAEMCKNAESAILQVEESNLRFSLESCCGIIRLTALQRVIEIHNIALGFHAERAMRHFQKAVAMSPKQAREEAHKRGVLYYERKEALKDANGHDYNRCGAGIFWMRGNLPVFNMAAQKAPENCDSQLRLMSVTFGVPRDWRYIKK